MKYNAKGGLVGGGGYFDVDLLQDIISKTGVKRLVQTFCMVLVMLIEKKKHPFDMKQLITFLKLFGQMYFLSVLSEMLVIEIKNPLK